MPDPSSASSGQGARRAPRVMVLGNCQAWGMAACLQQRRGGWDVSSVFVGELGSAEEAAALAASIDGYDIVLAQPVTRPDLAALNIDRLRERAARLVAFPRIVYTGLHPDMIKLASGEGGLVAAPTGNLGSRIAAASFRLGLPPERAERLFNAYVFARLGYFDEPAKADRFQIELGRQVGMELEPTVAAWRARGVFMHHPLHPMIGAADDLAVLALRQLGEGAEPGGPLPPDPLAGDNVWPVLPELARRLGVEGGRSFRTKAGETLDLSEFIARSYRIYEAAGRERLGDPRLAATVEALDAELSGAR